MRVRVPGSVVLSATARVHANHAREQAVSVAITAAAARARVSAPPAKVMAVMNWQTKWINRSDDRPSKSLVVTLNLIIKTNEVS